MIEGNFVALPAALAGAALLVLALRARADPWTIVIGLAAVGHLASVAAVTLFPLPVQREVIEEGRSLQLAANNFVPLVHTFNAIVSGRYPAVLQQSLGNFVMLVPLGIYVPVLWPRMRAWRSVLALGLCVSVAIEALQFLISAFLGFTYKIVDADDVLINTAGVMAGYLLYRLLALWWTDVRPASGERPSGDANEHGGEVHGGV